MSAFLEVTDITKSIDNFTLGPINLTVEPGTITALVGSNGSGKSTLLKLIMNLVKPNEGTITMFNEQVNSENEDWKKHVAYQPQTPIGYDALTGNHLKELISQWYPMWDESLFQETIKNMDVPLNIKFDKLSQGAQQKLMLALTIARHTKLLILDEPTSFLDIPSKKVLMDLLIDWMEQDERSIILASHQTEDIKKLADYLTVLSDGKLIDTFEKEYLIDHFKRYFIIDESIPTQIPGEASREETSIISSDPSLTEQYFEKQQIKWQRTNVDLEDIITIMLTKES